MIERIYFYDNLFEFLNKIDEFENQWDCSINLKSNKICIEVICSYISITGIKKEISTTLTPTKKFNNEFNQILNLFKKEMREDFEYYPTSNNERRE